MIQPNSRPLPQAAAIEGLPPASLDAAASKSRPGGASGSPLFELGAAAPDGAAASDDADQSELREAFNEFVGQTFFGSMVASMRKTVGKPAYMHGGRGEEVFQKQLDDLMVQNLTESSADSIGDPMFQLFQMQRR